MPTHLLAIDLDFTLLDANREIADANRDAIRRAVDGGFAVLLASGRGAAGMRRFATHLELESPMVTCNGARVVLPDGTVIQEHLLEPERVAKVIEFARAGGHHLHLYCGEEVLMPFYTPWVEVYINNAKQHPPRAVGWEGMSAATPNKAIIVTSAETVKAIENDARAMFNEEEAVLLSEPEYLEFVCPGATKATGIAAAAEHLGIPRENTAAIGDYYNDVPMLRWAGHSAAVENAPDDVKREAKIVMPRHDEFGVAAYIEYLFSNLGAWTGDSIVYNEGRAG